ncbi:MAG: hypothetical protein KAT05_15975 [Spirochaetes bacterium]|nr:hypothetical protein [Spirochaetota bacterium]
MVQFKYLFGLSILIIVLISGCVNSNEHTPEYTQIKSFDYSTKLSSEEQIIVGEWISQSGITTLVFNTDRTGRREGRADCQKLTGNDRDYCMDNGGILLNETYYWRIENKRLITESFYPDAIVGGSWLYYINENDLNEFILRDFSGTDKDTIFHLTKVINLHAQQIILNGIEIEQTIGVDWKNENKFTNSFTKLEVSSVIYLLYRNPNIKITATGSDEINIRLLVSPSISEANNQYQSLNSKLQENGKIIRNKIDVGDTGELYSNIDADNKNVNGGLYLIFRKNNVIFVFDSPPEVNAETAFELAKKQEEKISRILEIIK